jgi:hypothetical protein
MVKGMDGIGYIIVDLVLGLHSYITFPKVLFHIHKYSGFAFLCR